MKTTHNTASKTKAFLIARVSDPSQREALPAQELRLKEYASRQDLDSELFSFDETAYKEDRVKFVEIVNKACKHPEPFIMVFDKIDRLTRDCSSVIVRKLKDLVKEGRAELHFPSDGLVYHRNSPAHDKTRLDMGMVFGAYYSNAISDNVKRKIEQKLHDKEWPGKAPIGYLNVKSGESERKMKKDIIPDPQRRAAIVKIYELRLQGISYRVIARMMREEGLVSNTSNPKPISQSVVEGVLKNPFYYGVMKYSGGLHPHRYEPIIDKQTFDEAQKISEARNGGGAKPKSDIKRPYTFNGVLKCGECGCSVSSYVKKGHTYMHCSKAKGDCSQPHLKEVELLEDMLAIIEKTKLNEQLIEMVLADMKDKHDSEQLYYQSIIRDTRVQYKKLEQRLEVAYEDRMDGRITVDEYDKLANKYKSEMESLDRKMVKATSNDKSFVVDSSYLLKLADYAPVLFKSSKAELKNKLLRILLSNLKINEKNLIYQRWTPFDVIAGCLQSSSWLTIRVLNIATGVDGTNGTYID